YKISWNPKNVVLAGKSGATFKKEGKEVHLRYEELFNDKRYVIISELEPLCWYPNRDSISYASLYGLGSCPTFIRTTLRHPDFMYGWKNIIELKLTDETVQYETDNKTLMGFFKEHMDRNGFGEWLTQKMQQQLESTKSLLEGLMNIVTLEEEDEESGLKEMMLVNEKGNLEALDIDDLKLNAAATVADTMREANLTLKQLFFLGMDDDETHINKGMCSAADVLQFALEKKLALQEHDKDMVVMLHEIEFTKGDQRYLQKSSLIVKGEDNTQTAMAKTVGLPLGIATKLILNGAITIKGLQIPIIKEIYEPVLQELQAHGIHFTEERVQV
ncbi:MAG: hypothetical protein ICV84_01105, partial [Flavisolibacter sp.]|nr:hypothetical protein [Flavisolibacter sp.]